MKITIEFNLPEEEQEYNESINGSKYLMAIQEFDKSLRSKYKYENQETISIEDARKLLNDCMQASGVNLYE